MHDERLVSSNRLHTFRSGLRTVIGSQVFLEVRNILASPLALVLVPPDQLLAFAPRLAIRTRRCAVVQDATIRRPREAPSVAEIIVRLAHVRDVVSRFGMNAGIDPATAGSASVVL